MTFFIRDYGLTPSELEAKYEKDEQHPEYSIRHWGRVVAQQGTLLGYWEWVRMKLRDEEDELARDSPYYFQPDSED